MDVNERAVLKYQQLAREKKRVSARDARIPAFMALANETDFPHEGVVDFVDNKVDPGTGTIRCRGVFPNPDGLLTPGFFARVRVPGSGRYTALLVPDAAVGTDQNIKYLLVVKPRRHGRSAAGRPSGAVFGRLRAIEKGVTEADRVIVNGLHAARPGSKVAPTEEPIPADALQLTAPGSPTTRELPATRDLERPPGAGTVADAAASAGASGPPAEPASPPGRLRERPRVPGPSAAATARGAAWRPSPAERRGRGL